MCDEDRPYFYYTKGLCRMLCYNRVYKKILIYAAQKNKQERKQDGLQWDAWRSLSQPSVSACRQGLV